MPVPAGNKLSILLYPFSLLYGLVSLIRNLLYDYHLIKSHEFPFPVISVGNITAGGTGKTPHVEYLVELLKDQFNVAVLSRGYKRKTRHFILAGPDSSVKDIGDEPVQMKQKFPDVHVAVDRRRVNGVKQLMKKIPYLDVILLDDAYQHRRVKPGLSILLIDFNRPITEDRLLPVGLLREKPYEKRRANIIIVTKCPERLGLSERRLIVKDLSLYAIQHLYFTSLVYRKPVPVFKDANTLISLSEMKEASSPAILMVTGIANPGLFKHQLRSVSTRIREMTFPDHHSFDQSDMNQILKAYKKLEGKDRFIITTEKDAMRLREFANIDKEIKNRMFYIPIVTAFLNEDKEIFNNQILEYVNNNRKDNRLHKRQD
jgi:tetraacyldisaccharide 4'-kinase